MRGEAVFEFKCGSTSHAGDVADWLECHNWPDDLRITLEETFGDLSDLASIVFSADPNGRRVVVQATNGSDLEMMGMVLNYAMRKWRSVPSPQGFTFGIARDPEMEPVSYDMLDYGEFDGGAVVFRRGAEPEYMFGSEWLETALRRTKYK